MIRIIEGDCRRVLKKLEPRSVQCCVTSPPYYGLRDYGHESQIGLEKSPEEYVAQLVSAFRAVAEVLRDDGTLWLNLGDSYATRPNGTIGNQSSLDGSLAPHACYRLANGRKSKGLPSGTKHKDLLGIPWMVAFALRADGWYLRSSIIWHKPNPMPESCDDRPTSAYENVFLLSKNDAYFYDAAAIAEPALNRTSGNVARIPRAKRGGNPKHKGGQCGHIPYKSNGFRNARNVWTIASQPFEGAHFATMPPDLAARCIKAGSRKGDTVLDPFGGAGTTGMVADHLGRSAILIELNSQYRQIAQDRVADLFSEVKVQAPR